MLFGPPSTTLPKPAVPYQRGWRFSAQAHVPPPPTRVYMNCCINSDADFEERGQLSPVQRCLRNLPLPGKSESRFIDLEILEPIKVGDGHNSQVFTVRIQDPGSTQPGDVLVAKAYDPLYFEDDEGYINPFLCTDKHYTHEVRTYECLSDFQGKLVPRFYGSYSLSIPVEKSSARTVRMILLEKIPGVAMAEANPENYAQHTRKQMMKSLVDFETEAYTRDMAMPDLVPRNVMVKLDETLVFIDFGATLFGRKRDDPGTEHIDMLLGEYITPLLRWTGDYSRHHKFKDWIDWDWDAWIKEEYAHTSSSITPKVLEYFGPL